MHCGQILRKTGRYAAERPALWCDDRVLSYGEIFERSSRLVNGLSALGIVHQDRVATLGPNAVRSLEEIAGLALGGFVRIPLHYRNAVDLHIFMLNLVEARALITDRDRYETVRDRLAEVPSLEHVIVDGGGPIDYERLLSQSSPEDPAIDVRPDDDLHVAFTSGTTGRPKATVQTHRSWLGVTAENMLMLPPLAESDRYLAAGPLSHQASTVIFSLIARGAGTVVMPSYDPGRAAELIERHRVTFTVMVPTMVHMLINAPETVGRDLSSLRIVMAAGSPITERTIREVTERLGDVLYLGYGQSEGIPATMLTAAEIRAAIDSNDPRRLRSTGRPVPRAMVKILDEDGRELPPGEIGEIAIDTPGNMRGFWGDPEATAARLTPDGFILTRDVGHMDKDGYLFLADRKEDMIISGGFNIWPAEVENAVASHPAVLEVAVVGVPHEKWGETPRAVVVLKPGMSADEQEIVDWCREKIGSMKKPTSVVFRDDPLPKSPVGKLLRRQVRLEEWPEAGQATLISGA